jgi:transcription antitermination factor NusG
MTQTNVKKWYVLTTKSRQEKKVAETLKNAGFTVYCPLQNVKRKWSDRIKIVEEPLFSSYIFIHIEASKRNEIFNFVTSIRYLFWLRKPAVVRTEEIEAIQKWLGHFDHEYIQVEKFEKGSLVQLKSGPFMEQKALLVDYGQNKAVIRLKSVGLQLTVKLKENEILPLKS